MCAELLSATPINMFPYSSHTSTPYTEAQWIPNTMSYIPGSDYDSSSYTAVADVNAQRRAPGIEVSSVPQHMLDGDRPKSSTDAYDEDNQYQQQFEASRAPRYNDSSMSTYDYQTASNLPLSPPTSSTAFLGQDLTQTQMTGSLSPASRSDPIPIAPNPSGMTHAQAFRPRANDDSATFSDSRKRRRTGSTPERPPELTEEERLLLKLKEDEGLPWKDIAMRFQQELGKTYQVPALQMRFKRLRERIRQWTDNDIQALEQAYEYWEKHQFEIIATKMLDFGCSERFPSKAVQRKWEELHADKFAALGEQPVPFGHGNSAAAYTTGGIFTGANGFFGTQQQNFFRDLSVGPGGTTGFSPFPSPGGGQYVFGQSAAAGSSLLPPTPGSIAGSASSVYGTSPLVSSGGAIQSSVSTGKFTALPSSYIRSTSFPTPGSVAGSPGPFSAADDAGMAISRTATVNEVGGVNMGLGLGLTMSSAPNQQQHSVRSGRQRSFSEM